MGVVAGWGILMELGFEDEYRVTAPVYDALVEPLARRIRLQVAKTLADGDGRLVLDLCCGTGRQARLLTGAGRRVIGVDRSPAMLARAGRIRRAGLNWILGDAAALGFHSARFDAAVVSFALHEKTRSSAVSMLRELARVLRPQGRLVILDFEVPSQVGSRILHRGIARIERAAGRRHFSNYCNYLRSGGLAPLLAAAHFQVSGTRHFYSRSLVLVAAEPKNRAGRWRANGSS